MAIAAEGDVEVVAEPPGERDVPALAPELGEALGVHGRVEVTGEAVADHHQGQPNGHVVE